MNFFRRMMMGRYGNDKLNNALLLLSLFLLLVEWITRWSWMGMPILALLCLCYFRMLSRNIQARYQENQKFLKWWLPKERALQDARVRFASRKTHRFFKCPQCKKRLRVPRGKGKITITCPHCKTQFSKKT